MAQDSVTGGTRSVTVEKRALLNAFSRKETHDVTRQLRIPLLFVFALLVTFAGSAAALSLSATATAIAVNAALENGGTDDPVLAIGQTTFTGSEKDSADGVLNRFTLPVPGVHAATICITADRCFPALRFLPFPTGPPIQA